MPSPGQHHRGLSCEPLASVASVAGRCLGGVGAPFRVSSTSVHHPVLKLRSSDYALVQSNLCKGAGLREGARFSPPEGCHRTSSPRPGFLLSHVRSLQGLGGMASNYRPFHAEHLCGKDALQDGDRSVSSVSHQAERLDVLCGPQGRVSASPHPSGQQKVSPVCDHIQGAFQFRSLCFGLSTAPQVFTRVMAPVAVILHRLGVRILRYLDDWLILAATKEQCLRARDIVLQVCSDLGIQINWDKSILTPSQETTYLGILIDSRSFTASPSPKRRDRLRSLVRDFLSLDVQPASLWRSLLGHLASLTQLILGGRLRTRSLQLALRNQWDFQDESALISWSPRCKEDLVWWVQERLDLGTSLLSLPPDQALWSDASDVGWGAYLESQGASGLWTSPQKSWSINRRELRAVFLGLQAFEPFLSSRIALFCDNTTAVAYLRNQGGTLSESLNEEAQSILRWAEERGITLIPQFILGAANVLADSLSRPNQVLGSEWTLHQEVVDSLLRKWSANVDLFATSLNFRLQAYFAPLHDPQALAVDSFLQDWSGLEAYAFPPFPLIRRVLNKARQSPGLVLTLIAPMWPQKEWFPDLLQVLLEPPLKLPARQDLLRQPHFHRFHLGLDSLQLHAWRLSGGLPDRLVSPDVWLNS